MNTDKESAFRILSHRESSVQPMFDAAPIGPLSPSSSLLVERRDLEPTSWQSHLLEDQLFHLFMKPAVIGFSLKDAAIAKIPLTAARERQIGLPETSHRLEGLILYRTGSLKSDKRGLRALENLCC